MAKRQSSTEAADLATFRFTKAGTYAGRGGAPTITIWAPPTVRRAPAGSYAGDGVEVVSSPTTDKPNE